MANKLEGLGELRREIANLGGDSAKRIAVRAVASAANMLKREAKRIAQSLGLRRTGALLNNIAFKRERTPDGIAQYHLGVRHGRNITRSGEKKLLLKVGKSGRIVRANDPYYWRFLELTTKRREGTPFIGAALENKQGEAVRAMEDRIAREIEKAVKK